jgi:hypothetical protein
VTKKVSDTVQDTTDQKENTTTLKLQNATVFASNDKTSADKVYHELTATFSSRKNYEKYTKFKFSARI